MSRKPRYLSKRLLISTLISKHVIARVRAERFPYQRAIPRVRMAWSGLVLGRRWRGLQAVSYGGGKARSGGREKLGGRSARRSWGARHTPGALHYYYLGSLGSTVPSQQYRVRERTEKSILGGLACLLSRRLSNLASLACTPFLIHRKFHLDRITI